MRHMHQKFLKEGNVGHKFLRCTYIWDNNFEFMRSEIVLDKFDLEFAETVKAKPTRTNSGFIIYSNTIDFDGKWLDNSGYLITQCQKLLK